MMKTKSTDKKLCNKPAMVSETRGCTRNSLSKPAQSYRDDSVQSVWSRDAHLTTVTSQNEKNN